jgi:hypothetical protein
MPLCFLEAPEGIKPAAKTVMMQNAHAALAGAYPFLDELRIYLREYRESASHRAPLPLFRETKNGNQSPAFPQIISSVQPSCANSAARSGASPSAKNSSSCGGLTAVLESIACACPR